MKLKKLNAILGIAIIAALLCHAGTMTYSLITHWYNFTVYKYFAHLAETIMFLHVLISICIFFFSSDGSSLLRYPRRNISTIVQRASAVLIIVLVHMHISNYAHMATGETLTPAEALFNCLIECVYILSVFAHTAVSFSKALVTLGLVRSVRASVRLERIVYAVCAVLAAAAVFAVIRFFIGDII